MAKKTKVGRKPSQDPKQPLTLRLNQSKLDKLTAKAEQENRTARELAEMAVSTYLESF